MKRLLIGLAFVVAFTTLSGCSGQQAEKGFVLGKIIYKVDPKAQESMQALKTMLAHIRGEETLSEKNLQRLYIAADADRNRVITSKEAKSYEDSFSRQYEDSLGGVKFVPDSPG
jgi:Skp family chaperone for outer membrane proteins